ncbi:MAG: serine/threonine protein kinase [Deltaproteobacteria bacterium]|nr:MAG: serine/threonine protein kinase [Deltaproteobacteria bacterium]
MGGMIPPPAPTLQPFGRYRLVCKLAAGGMAEIFLAVDSLPVGGCRFVIVKRIHPACADDPDYVDHFLTEGAVALRASHPHLPVTYELGDVDGAHYLAMEFIHGPTFLDLLRLAQRGRGAVSVRTAVTVGRAVAAALDHLHTLRDVYGRPLGVIHRDVTPQNTLVAYDGTIKLIDFGIARASFQVHQTRSGVVKGKFSYMAPEQFHGVDDIDARADLFSLGVMLHESLVGRPLFRGASDRDTIDRVLHMPIPSPTALRADVPEALSRVVLRALARDRDRRYARAADLLADLERVADTYGLGISLTELRREVRALCGPPHEWTLPALADAPNGPDATASSSASDLPAAADASTTAEVDERLRARGSAPAPSDDPERLDDDLIYFLAQAGVTLPVHRRRRARTTHADVEFSRLLATLDR